MGYDLHIYSVRPIPTDAELQQKLRAKSWQIVINPSDRLLPEDVDDELAALLPGIRYLTELNLEGSSSPEALRRLKITAKTLAKSAHGLVVDPQEDTTETPVKRFSPPSSPRGETTFSVLRFSWWLLNDALLDRAKRDALFALFERLLPEAMPKRYGDHEPPQHLYEQTGKDHLHRFLDEHLQSVLVWYPHRPVATLSMACPNPLGAGPQGFRTHHLCIQVESAVLDQPGWPENLRQFWLSLSQHLQPIYGEVRTAGGFVRHGPTVYTKILSDDADLNRSWFFRGIPKELGLAVVLGAEYQKLWPEFLTHTKVEDGLAFASLPDWSAPDADLTTLVGPTPNQLALRPHSLLSTLGTLKVFGMRAPITYPPTWPFSPPFPA